MSCHTLAVRKWKPAFSSSGSAESHQERLSPQLTQNSTKNEKLDTAYCGPDTSAKHWDENEQAIHALKDVDIASLTVTYI